MSLSRYKQKRSAGKTPEPFGGKPTGNELRFVIQKHAASHLHYDFRLEMQGVLKSWAVPKGPSTDPAVKRLAMMVEDHPYDYRDFEGIIRKGQYGGGTVIVWDEGTYEPAEEITGDVRKKEKHLLHQLYSGKLKFILRGKKLKGEFALVKASGRGENAWLLMKLDDKYASTADITLKDKSVISKKTIEQMSKSPDRVYGQINSKKNSTAKDKKEMKTVATKKVTEALKKKESSNKKLAAKTGRTPNIKELLKGTTRKAFYDTISEPMLATLVDKAFDEEGWLYEIKWDGYRAVAFMNKNVLELKSRNNKSFNEKFYPIYNELKKLRLNAIIDGEVVVVDENGQANFSSLQNWRSEADGILQYYVFDILWYEGYDLTALPLVTRKSVLKTIIKESALIKLSQEFETSGIDFLEAARQMGLEGIMAKRKDSIYQIGNRTKDWLKIKANKRQEVVIGGYTKNIDTKKAFSSLLVGVFEKGKLVYTGKVGTGFNTKTQMEMMKQFKPLVVDKSPFTHEPDINKPSRFRPNPPKAEAIWLKPKLICEVSYAEITNDGVMRHPSFEGMRNDKDAKKVLLEREVDTKAVVKPAKSKLKTIAIDKPVKGERKTLLNPKEETQVKKINGHELKFTNLSKIFWPDVKGTKRDMLNYYYQVAPVMLPYLKDRPMSLNRYPNGINGQSFYQKDMTGKAPDWIETYLYHSGADNRDRNYLVCKKEADILYMANLGSIEMNPWNSKEQSEDNPDWCVIDLDPDKNSFDQVIQCAQVTHEILESLGVPSYCKTSGSTGLHVYIPLGAKYDYEASKEFGRAVATMVHRELPKFTSIERLTANRGGRMYIDFLQNRPQATLAAPYSVRPKPGATVSMPLHWDEVRKGLKMSDFTIYNAIDRLKETGDLFKPVIGKGIDLGKVIKKLEQFGNLAI